MASYADAATSTEPPQWILDLVDHLYTSDFVRDALWRALLQAVLGAAPGTTTDGSGASLVAAGIRLTELPLPRTGTDEAHEVCREYTLHVLGHHIGTWTICHSVVTETDEPATVSVTMTLSQPPALPDPAPSASPEWISRLPGAVVTADFVQESVVSGLLAALVGAAPHEPADEPALTVFEGTVDLSSQAVGGSPTDEVTTQCTEHFLTVGGVQLYHWTVCTQTLHVPPATPAPAPSVHLEALHPRHHH